MTDSLHLIIFTDGVVQVMIDAVRNYSEDLTQQRLFNWHAALFPTGRSGIHPITVARIPITSLQRISLGAFDIRKCVLELVVGETSSTFDKLLNCVSLRTGLYLLVVKDEILWKNIST